ncbi:eae-like domain protein [Enterobacter bugandensis]|uniref:eae-like domain protein n=1 Tax=Enterobacter bugandensis TaxID=881260 RepID=UPI003B214AAB
MTANKTMTGEQLDELMTVAVNMQRDSEKAGDRPSAMFAYAVQVAVLELRKVRNDAAALAAENAGLKDEISNITFMRDDDFFGSTQRAQEVMGRLVNVKTPATDAFLAEVRAQGVEAAIATAKNVVAQEFQYKDFETTQRVCSKFPESDLVGKVEMVEWLEDFAAQLRKGVQS